MKAIIIVISYENNIILTIYDTLKNCEIYHYNSDNLTQLNYVAKG